MKKIIPNLVRKIAGLWLFLCLYPSVLGYQNNTDWIISRYTVKDGLTHNDITSIIEDKEGFIWIGTRGGLNRFDGYDFRHYKPSSELNSVVPGASIERLYDDHTGKIWIGTKTSGLGFFDPSREHFTNFPYIEGDSSQLNDFRIISFLEDSKNRIWAGGWNHGVNLYDSVSQSFSHFLPDQKIGSFVQTRDGRIWAFSYFGIWEFNEGTGDFEIIPGMDPEVYKGYVMSQEDPKGPYIWISSWKEGLVRFNYNTFECKSFNPFPELSEQFVYSILIDGDFIWVGTWSRGVMHFHPEEEKFINVSLSNDEIENYGVDIILDIFKDSQGNVWLGTDGTGMYKLSPNQSFRKVKNPGKDATPDFANSTVTALFRDSSENMWMVTIQDGLLIFNKNEELIRHVPPEVLNIQNITNIHQFSHDTFILGSHGQLAELTINGEEISIEPFIEKYPYLNRYVFTKARAFYQNGNELWIGTQQNGLYILSKEKDRWQIKHHFPIIRTGSDDQGGERISSIMKDGQGQIWIGTYNGLYRVNPDLSFVGIESIAVGKAALPCEIILCLTEDNQGRIWFGTPCGLNVLLPENSKYRHVLYSTGDGLSDDYVNSVLVDNKGMLWLSNNIGVSRLNPETGKITNFYKSDGVNILKFNENIGLNTGHTFYFGGLGGLVAFRPDQVSENKNIPRIVFTDLLIFNEPIHAGQEFRNHVVLEKSINHVNEIRLPYQFDDLAIQIAALDFTAPEKNQYSYFVEGLSKEWIQLGTRRWINFNHLKPGDYVLMVKGSNNNAVWNEEPRNLMIHIRPPLYLSWYAFVFYGFFGFGLMLLIRFIAIKQERLARELEVLTVKSDKERELNEMKLRFFTNISHEFRTPLTLIMGPLHEILDKAEKLRIAEPLYNKLNLIRKNASRLLDLVNQLLDFRKVESGKMRLSVTETDIAAFIDEVALSFRELSRINQVDFKIDTLLRGKMIFIDRDKMETVLNNLLSNAFKFCNNDGKVHIKVYDTDDKFFIEVVDNGKGISQEHVHKIFDRFYQAESEERSMSSGIGLYLVKQLVEIHKGEISVESSPGKGTCFKLSFLKGRDHFSDEDITTEIRPRPGFIRNDPYAGLLPRLKRPIQHSDQKKRKLLIVEDDKDVREYLISLLSKKYTVNACSNGEEGFEQALSELPDLIVSDIMMPIVDGFELCKLLRENERTNAVPIMLLTAKTADQYQIFGTRMGADAYISKPFNPELLEATIHRLILSYEQSRRKFSKLVRLEPAEIEITPYEETFVQSAIKVIENNIDNNELSADFLASKMNMSQSSLYRKLKSILGLSINEFIRKIRLRRAAQLLKDESKTITEVAFEVGFNDLKYFRSCFIKEFHMTPHQYKQSV